MDKQRMPPEDRWLTKTNGFPPPAQLGPNFVRWRASWIAEWEATRPRGVRDAPRTRGPAG